MRTHLRSACSKTRSKLNGELDINALGIAFVSLSEQMDTTGYHDAHREDGFHRSGRRGRTPAFADCGAREGGP